MQECFEKHPEEYGKYSDEDGEKEGEGGDTEIEQKGKNRTDEEIVVETQGQTETEEVTKREQTLSTAETS